MADAIKEGERMAELITWLHEIDPKSARRILSQLRNINRTWEHLRRQLERLYKAKNQ